MTYLLLLPIVVSSMEGDYEIAGHRFRVRPIVGFAQANGRWRKRNGKQVWKVRASFDDDDKVFVCEDIQEAKKQARRLSLLVRRGPVIAWRAPRI